MDQVDSRVSSKVEEELGGAGIGACGGYDMPRRTCRNVKQTMNDALLNVVNLPAKMPTNDGAIRSDQVMSSGKEETHRTALP